MEKRLLLTTQKNDIFQAIIDLDLDPSDFEIIEVASLTSDWLRLNVSKLIHIGTGHYFLFDIALRTKEWRCVYFPNSEGLQEILYRGKWDSVFIEVRKWLLIIKREIESEDLWSSFLTNKFYLDKSALIDYENIPFNKIEKQYITDFLNKIEQFIADKFIDKNNLVLINQQIDYLKEASIRQGRKDWIHTAIGVFFTIAVSYGFPRPVVMELFQMIGKGLSKLMIGVDLIP